MLLRVEELHVARFGHVRFTSIIRELGPEWTNVRGTARRFIAAPVTLAEEAAMVQHEGAGRRLFTREELAAERRVAPWDLAAVLMHARWGILFERLPASVKT